MSVHHARGANAYRQTGVQSSSPLELVVMLYDGLLRHVVAARNAHGRTDLAGRREAFSKALAILTELQSTLNLAQGGEVAASLDRLYTYMIERLLDASARKDMGALDELEKLLRPLREAWAEIATPMAAGARP